MPYYFCFPTIVNLWSKGSGRSVLARCRRFAEKYIYAMQPGPALSAVPGDRIPADTTKVHQLRYREQKQEGSPPLPTSKSMKREGFCKY